MKTTMVALLGATLFGACSAGRDNEAIDAQRIEQDYGVPGAFAKTITTADGPMKGTLVPITLADGSTGHIFIPQKVSNAHDAVYVQDEQGLHPIRLSKQVRREEMDDSPAVAEPRAQAPRAKKRSWEREALIIGGSAGAGTAIGALAGGKKGAGVGAAAGGVGGLIYDLVTRDK
ncbi:MAG: hypothetical protein ABJA98_25665 [Acidobacteriota bacterium]